MAATRDTVINEKKIAYKKKFDDLNASRVKVVENIKQLQGQLNIIDSELLKLQGAYKALDDLIETEKLKK